MTNKNLGDRNQNHEKFDFKKESPLSKPEKISAPLITKSHYSFEEALLLLKETFKNFSRQNLLNHGFQGDLSFFLKVPSHVEVRSYFPARYSGSRVIKPSYLIIDSLDCEEIERQGQSYQNEFQKGYVYDERYGFIEALPNYSSVICFDIAPHWIVNGLRKITITAKNLLITHFDLMLLLSEIPIKLTHDPHKPKPEKNFSKVIPQSVISINDVASTNPDCVPSDLLRRTIQKKMNMLVRVPTDLIVRSSIQHDYATGVEYLNRPQFFEINDSDCWEIYCNDSVWIADFRAGYIADKSGQMNRITPVDERPELVDENASWMAYRGNNGQDLKFTCQDLYVLPSDVAELLDKDECGDLKISKRSMDLLFQESFVSLEEAVKIAKLGHPECTTNHLLRIGHQGKFNIVTPIPVAVEVKQYCIHSADNVQFDTSAEDPVLLDLFSETCLDIERYGKTETDRFSSEYWSFDYRLRRKSALGANILATFYKDNSHKIALKPDKLFIRKADLVQVINDNYNLWDLINRLLEVESKRRETNTTDPNADTVTVDQEESSFTDSRNDSAINEPIKLNTAKLASREVSEKNDKQLMQNEALAEFKSIKLLSRIEVMQRLNIGKSTMDNRINPNSKYYDPEFPKPVGDGRRKKSWVESEVNYYQELLINNRSSFSRVG